MSWQQLLQDAGAKVILLWVEYTITCKWYNLGTVN